MIVIILLLVLLWDDLIFFREMHYSAKRGLAIACRSSVCLSVRPFCTVSVLIEHLLGLHFSIIMSQSVLSLSSLVGSDKQPPVTKDTFDWSRSCSYTEQFFAQRRHLNKSWRLYIRPSCGIILSHQSDNVLNLHYLSVHLFAMQRVQQCWKQDQKYKTKNEAGLWPVLS